MINVKRWLRGSIKSATMWFNGLVATLLAAVPIIQDSLPQLMPMLPADTYKWLASTLIIGNILLRIKTNRDLRDK